ncbi:3beta-hydroxysteroid-dehydrogenase/decarboxylase isoform 3 [Vitis vinifera]|uniref:3beta-hydroxysteroid-dehydrogenase/decarboxylase isoform 3 n=1 Tax=Vitis vinifera TaxID=29760 RepID=A0A438CBV9_VITVI|nr:3beta-hydroxysteroid-dehydrogenase/decarboxylase isoform 3 [Vitis vinifera]
MIVEHGISHLAHFQPLFKLPAGMVLYVLSLVEWMRDKLDFRSNHPVSAQYVVQIPHALELSMLCSTKHIGYSPVVSLEEGVTLTTESFSQLSQDSSVMAHRDFDEQSKVDKLLGGGKVADILLWRDEKKTFTCFLALFLMFYWFFLCGRTFISSAAKLLLLVTAILSGQGILPTNM